MKRLVLYFQWHIGYMTDEYTPTYRGFDSHYGYLGGCDDYYDHTYSDGRGTGNVTKVWHRNTFSNTGPLWGESTVDRWIPLTKGQ